MSQQHVNLKNLAEGSQESLRALIQALLPDKDASPDETSKGDAFARLTDKLTEVIGPETTEAMKQSHNERGELVNEEGLPIVDITEPVDLHTRAFPPVEPLLPLATLPLPVRARLRERRNRILDLLEEEERQTELLEKERELQQRAEILRKRNEEATREKNESREARDLQKKMGRALLHNMGRAREKEEKEKDALRLRDEEMDLHRFPSNKKKTVTFAERPQSHANIVGHEISADRDTQWGDITPARLHSIKRPTLASQSLLDKHPVKMSVVERVPGGQSTLPQTSQSIVNIPDSDDESNPEQISNLLDNTSDEDEPILEEDEVDFDFAQQQREIAMEYYRKRNIIEQETAFAMLKHTLETDEESIESSRKGKKPVVSQFRATKLASAYGAGITNADSFSPGAPVLPATSIRTLQKAIKMGKLDSDGQLVGADDNSASEDEEPGMQEVLALLQKGEIYNLGQNGEYLDLHAGHPSPSPSTFRPDYPQPTSNLTRRSGSSKFKASRAAFGRAAGSRVMSPGSQVDEAPSPSMTPVSHQDRSSPKLDESSETCSPNPTAERLTTVHSPDPMRPKAPYSPHSMIIGSPSFPMPKVHRNTVPCPSLPPTSRRPERPPAVLSAKVYESKRRAPLPSVPLSENNSLEITPKEKVSRFKAERM